MMAQIGFSVMISLMIAITVTLLVYGTTYKVTTYTGAESAKISAEANSINRLLNGFVSNGSFGYYFGG